MHVFPKFLGEILGKFIHAAEVNARDPLVSVRITASWALANICDSLRHCINGFTSERCLVDLKDCSQLTSLLIDCSLRLTRDNDKIKANAVRALGNLSRFVQCSSQSSVYNRQDHGTGFDILKNGKHMGSNLVPPPSWEDSRWLEGMVQAFLSCVSTGNVKVRWNVCHALSNLFLNETLKLQDVDWAPSVFSILLLLLRDSSNFKIRIQAAAALAVPPTILDYGRSFSDVVQGVENTLENLSSDQIAAPTSFKYRVALEKQLTSTMLHVLGLASRTDHQPVQDFLIKKASFLEEWIQVLCTSLGDATPQLDAEHSATRNHKKQVIFKAVQSLIAVYDGRNHHGIARRFDKLVNRIP